MDLSMVQGVTLTQVTTAITAVGALGTAAFGLVDASKLVPWTVIGFGFVKELVEQLTPAGAANAGENSALTRAAIIDTLKANWLNGMAVPDQKVLAKTLFKLSLSATTAPQLATATGVNADVLKSVATKLASGQAADIPSGSNMGMTQAEMDLYGRFDVLLATVIDRAYQKGDRKYRLTAKVAAGVVAVFLAEAAAYSMRILVDYGTEGSGVIFQHVHPVILHNALVAALVGLIATPLAPVAKDLTTALSTAVKAVQSVRG